MLISSYSPTGDVIAKSRKFHEKIIDISGVQSAAMVIPAVITLMPHMSALLDNIKNQYFKQVERSPASQVSLLVDHRDCQKLTTH